MSSYLKAGIGAVSEMEALATAGIRGSDAVSYTECGFSVEDMLAVANSGITSGTCLTVIEHGIEKPADILRTVVAIERHGIGITSWAKTRRYISSFFEPDFRERLFEAHISPLHTARTCQKNRFSLALLSRCDSGDFKTVVQLTEEGEMSLTASEFRNLINFIKR
jgi:hypothetical protein